MNNRLTRYRAAAIKHYEGTRNGDYKSANAGHAEMAKVLHELVAAKQDKKLLVFFKEDSPWVQLWAATHLLEVEEELSLSILSKLSLSDDPLVSMTADTTIESWKDGELSFRQ